MTFQFPQHILETENTILVSEGKNTMDKEKEKIMKLTTQIILSEGFHNFTMDYLAQKLKMSKKTFYKYFSSKEELLEESIFSFIRENVSHFEALIEMDIPALEKLSRLFSAVIDILRHFSEKFTRDMRFYSPELWEKIDNFRTERISKFFSRVVEQGRREGSIAITNPVIFMSIFVSAVRSTVTPEFMLKHNLKPGEVLEETLRILLGGVLTDKGRKVLDKINFGDIK